MICEFCKKSHNGEFASGRFCEEVCYRKFVSLKRNFKQKEKIKKEQENYILNPKKCNNCSCDLSYEKRKRKFCSKNCSSKFSNKGNLWRKNCRRCNKIPQNGVLCNECRKIFWDNDPMKVLIDNGQKKAPRWALMKIREYSCEGENCSVKDEWCGKKIVLQFDHINGKKNDHRPENIRWLCPNCHSQTNTFAGKNLKNPLRISSKKIQD